VTLHFQGCTGEVFGVVRLEMGREMGRQVREEVREILAEESLL
jgi:hypothetical protein